MDILIWAYVLSALVLAVYAMGTFVLLLIWWRQGRNAPVLPEIGEEQLPSVTIQLPLFNEREVIGRLIDAVAALDYPSDRLHIQVLDDSNDDTSELVAQRVAQYARQGVSITHIQRREQHGYKAGALADAMDMMGDDLVAVFDADFVPAPDFLRKTVPYFYREPRLGMVQVRWGHLNPDENLLVRAQALSLDGHFVVEQTARSRGGLLLNFSGSAGVWRADCIRDAGGWSFATLAEDLDLSYRAQLRGWRFLYLPDVVVPAEIPPQMAAYKRQQARWAKGSTQNLLRYTWQLWRNPRFNLGQKLMGTAHLCQYMAHPFMLLLLLLTPPLLYFDVLDRLALAPLGLASLGAPIMYVVSQRYLHPDWPRRLMIFPILLGLGTGLALNNTLAVLSALRGGPNVFQRTPKFRGHDWQKSKYALRGDWTILAEAFLAIYSFGGGLLALQNAPSLAPFAFIYAYAFGMVMLWGLTESYLVRHNVSEPPIERASV